MFMLLKDVLPTSEIIFLLRCPLQRSSLQRGHLYIHKANSCLFHTSQIVSVYPPKPMTSQLIPTGELTVADGECGANLLHLFMFEFFVERRSPFGGYQNAMR